MSSIELKSQCRTAHPRCVCRTISADTSMAGIHRCEYGSSRRLLRFQFEFSPGVIARGPGRGLRFPLQLRVVTENEGGARQMIRRADHLRRVPAVRFHNFVGVVDVLDRVVGLVFLHDAEDGTPLASASIAMAWASIKRLCAAVPVMMMWRLTPRANSRTPSMTRVRCSGDGDPSAMVGQPRTINVSTLPSCAFCNGAKKYNPKTMAGKRRQTRRRMRTIRRAVRMCLEYTAVFRGPNCRMS